MTFEEFAQEHGIEITEARAIPARTSAGSDWDKSAHHFKVTLAARGVVIWSGEYSLGGAHPVIWANAGFPLPAHYRAKVAADPHASPFRKGETKDSNARGAWGRMHSKPDWSGRGLVVADESNWRLVLARFDAVAPLDPADILESLQGDVSSADESFGDWCASYGYDDDSRRAERAFNACRDTAAQLRRGLGLEAFSAFLDVDGEESEDLEETAETLRARFAEEVEPHVVAQYGADDVVALDTAWNDWTDSLCKAGEISDAAYDQICRTDD